MWKHSVGASFFNTLFGILYMRWLSPFNVYLIYYVVYSLIIHEENTRNWRSLYIWYRIMLIYMNFKFNFLTKYSFIWNCWRIRMFSSRRFTSYIWHILYKALVWTWFTEDDCHVRKLKLGRGNSPGNFNDTQHAVTGSMNKENLYEKRNKFSHQERTTQFSSSLIVPPYRKWNGYHGRFKSLNWGQVTFVLYFLHQTRVYIK
jgi:hypothetical protein